ncbi:MULTISPECIES: cytochrome ubiquinol oxidase subunit I [Cryobacterium]|uniref:Cytochrome ubiquinol oxidase subunit I n=1 Tax=Cryobacterium zongtaii TaxID=1259217 RepID=A0A2S3Z7L7_9MICO|nr:MULTISPECIES: cytochrome ubiquinol oxidase subunit I [Cryobacterium]ASD22018.1 cytochrome ubiquinol oxidase subunit I [Cryobacterium sp. LW097]MEC5185346.1 cytochrome d ubiquinol oxidase subunit I [Cryobacterium sp. MP_3.1]POH61549.1 cytochrome ubiquinol oxidase subunit I [Cryobacterium zongtaii]POH64972.1 cytochrome ubiquinol oxidase subunit I [Cryobacterium zongtaii]POH68109.1 cytochrome ubiquinol oxidase subunit I [Cryobacterium zongtaii]
MNEWLDPLLLSRWQFGLTTIYHFLFVPLTIGLVTTVAIFQTAWYRTNKAMYLQLTHFFGKIFLINFAMGVVTGIVQEFQFGMNWSDYSRFVGDVFGAPLAFEGITAFFLEATFIGLWIFGWDKLPKGLHLATIWLTTVGSIASAYFIIAANAFMQNPVAYQINEEKGRAELTSIGELLTNPIALAAFPHTIFACFMVSAGLIISVAAWHLSRNQHLETMRPALKFGLWMMVISGALTTLMGDQLSLAMVAAQPMKMAAAEAMYNTATGAEASFSIFTLGTPDGVSELFSVRIPYLLSFLSTHTFDGTVEGINNLQEQYVQLYGPGDYAPIIWVTYWSFRWMIGLGIAHILVAVAGLWFTRKGRSPKTWMWKIAIWSFPMSLLAMSVGWVFTEMGRQPWLVFGLLKTADGVSPNVSGLEILISLIAFTLLYGALAVVEFRLILKAVQKGPDDAPAPDPVSGEIKHTTTVY